MKVNSYSASESSADPDRRREREGSLIVAAKNGSDAAVEELFLIYRARIYRIAYSITKNREDAEDVLQEAFLCAYVHLPAFRCESAFYSWVVRITINSSLTLLCRHRRRNEQSINGQGLDQSVVKVAEIHDSRRNPERIFSEQQEYSRLMMSIRKLPKPLRCVAELRIVCGLSLNESEAVLGVSKTAIKARAFRARKHLAMALRSRPMRVNASTGP